MKIVKHSDGTGLRRLFKGCRKLTLAVVPLLLFACVDESVAESAYPGMWRADSEAFGLLMLNLADGPDGSVVGMMLDAGQNQFTVAIWPEQGQMVGGIKGADGQELALLVQLEDEALYLDVYGFDEQGQVVDNGSRVVFSRHEGPATAEQAAPRVATSNTVQQLQNYLSGRHMLLSWIDGGAVYGKYYFLNTHFCSSGRYAVYASTRKQSVVSRLVQRGGWETYGTWRVTEQNGQVGISYQPDSGDVEFLPLQWTSNGPIAYDPNEFTPQGAAGC